MKNQYSVIPAEEPESDNMVLINKMPYPFAELRAGKSSMTKVKKTGFSKASFLNSDNRKNEILAMTAIVGKILKISTLMLILILSYSCDTMDSDDYFRFRNIDVNGCKGGYSTADEWVDWFIDGDSLFIVHHNAEYNCCLDEIEIEVERSGSVINIYEKEIASQPCFCLCPYDLEIELGNLLPGTYYIKIYHASGYLVATLIIDI